MTTNSDATVASTSEAVSSLITQLLHQQYPEELAVIGIPVCCVTETDLWAVPVRFCCGTYHIAFCRLEASTTQLIQPPEPAVALLPESAQLPSLFMTDNTLYIMVHTNQGDRHFPF